MPVYISYASGLHAVQSMVFLIIALQSRLVPPPPTFSTGHATMAVIAAHTHEGREAVLRKAAND